MVTGRREARRFPKRWQRECQITIVSKLVRRGPALTELETQQTKANVADLLDGVGDARKCTGARPVGAQMQDVTGNASVMWGPGIVGFGRCHLHYETDRGRIRADRILASLGHTHAEYQTRLRRTRAASGTARLGRQASSACTSKRWRRSTRRCCPHPCEVCNACGETSARMRR